MHVSDAQKAIKFYKELFQWKFEWIDDYSVEVFCKISKEKIASIHQIDNTVKGEYEYWVCTFGVQSIKISVERIKKLQGFIISEEVRGVLCSDGSEAFFYIQEV